MTKYAVNSGLEEYTPSLEEVRRHWGLAVDIHRRPERLEQFDRMIESIRHQAWLEGFESEGTRRNNPYTDWIEEK